jgi:hypothetical protein
MAQPQNEIKTAANMAYRGQPIQIDEFEEAKPLPKPASVTTLSRHQNFVPSTDIDYTDLRAVNKEIEDLRQRASELRIELAVAKRNSVRAKYVYEHDKRIRLIGITGGSASERESIAELMVEELYTRYLVSNTVADEIQQHARDIRTELDALKEVSNNLRRIIDIDTK